MTVLGTARLVLRPPVAGDADWIAAEVAHPEVQRMLTAPPHPYRREHAVAWLAAVADRPGHFVVEEDGRPQGVVTCSPEDRAEDLGYWLCRGAWGRGMMTEAAGAVLDWFFATGHDAATSGYITDNPASARVLIKLGFRPAEVVRRMCRFRGREVEVQRMVLDAAERAARSTRSAGWE